MMPLSFGTTLGQITTGIPNLMRQHGMNKNSSVAQPIALVDGRQCGHHLKLKVLALDCSQEAVMGLFLFAPLTNQVN